MHEKLNFVCDEQYFGIFQLMIIEMQVGRGERTKKGTRGHKNATHLSCDQWYIIPHSFRFRFCFRFRGKIKYNNKKSRGDHVRSFIKFENQLDYNFFLQKTLPPKMILNFEF